MSTRSYHRAPSEMRPVKITVGVNPYADGSALIEFGNTKVICTATIDKTLPQWLQNSGKGWVSAEYSMLPTATHQRTRRERDKVGGRTLEIQRLISRSLRATVDLKRMADKNIIIDCDVVIADGGTRTASITGGFVALALALKKCGLGSALVGQVAAVSVGMKQGRVLVDLDYGEDSSCDVDMNFVMMADGRFVEVQGTGEHQTFAREEMNLMTDGAEAALRGLLAAQSEVLK